MKKTTFSAVFLIIVFLASCAPSGKVAYVKNPEARTIGVPVKSVNWVRTHFGLNAKKEPRIYITMGQQGDNFFVAEVDPQTGAAQQFIGTVKDSNYPTATLMSRSGMLYVGAAYAGRLYRFDPIQGKLEDLGAINPEKAAFPCGIDEDKNGRIWIGSYGTADLTAFDPKTGEFQRFGRMDDVDMYNYPLVNSDGMICCKIMMTKPKCVVLDPKTGKKDVVGPVATKGQDTFDLRKDAQGVVHIVSSLGNFRIQGVKAVPEKQAAAAPVRQPFQDIKEVRFVGPEAQPEKELEIQMVNGDTKTFELNLQLAGTDIFYVHRGPDDRIYGSSILPLHLFRYNPESGELVDLGKASSAGGEAYSMANLNGKIYISSYTGATLSVYDPAKPYQFGNMPESNPRDLGRIDKISYRPRSTLTGPLGRVWVASIPDYGMWGGPLSWYDPATEEKKAYYNVVGDASCYTLAYLDKMDLIAVGTSIQGGSGTLPKVNQAVVFLWDYRNEKKAWEGTMDRPVEDFNALLALPDGRLVGTVRGGDKPELFLFNPDTKVFEKRADLPAGAPLDLSLTLGPDGKVYGFTKSCLYRLDPSTLKAVEILREENGFDIAGPILGNDIYYAKGPSLKSVQLFESPK
jgi:streptogramin lyase